MNFHHCPVDRQTAQRVSWTVESGQLSEGVRVKQFEQELKEKLGLRNPVCTNSGTSALQMGLLLACVRPEDEVILPPQTFIATGTVILQCGATPVFADIDPSTGNICPESIRKKITRRTKAVIPVHWIGLPCGMHELLDNPQMVVADAAQALGATYCGASVDRYADFTMYSFQATKHVTTGDGGVLCVPDKYVERARRLRWFGMDRELPPGPLGEREQDVQELGSKWHMNDVAATIGIGSLQGFPDRLRRRQAIGRRYREELEGVRGVTLLRMPKDRTHAYYAFGMLVDRRDHFVQTLKEKGIPTSVICRRIDRYTILGGVRDDLPGMDEFDRKQINLPCHSELSDEDVTKVIEAVKGGW